MSRFEPVFLPEGRELNGKVSQTFLRHYNLCNRSALLYQVYKGMTRTAAMVRGSAAHEVFARATKLMIAEGEDSIPPELAKVLATEVLEEMPVPFEEDDYIREMVYRWASEMRVEARSVIACETLFVLDLAGWEVRAKIDYAWISAAGMVAHVEDYKTSLAAVPLGEMSRKRSDGSLLGKDFQLILYALVLAFGVPVREGSEPCRNCDSSKTGEPDMCTSCAGTGSVRTEIREPFPVAAAAQEFKLEYVYPGIENSEGLMLRRPISLTRLELGEYRQSFEALLHRVAHSEESGEWDPLISDAACGECPAAAKCPIPAELRDYAGRINTVEEAAQASVVLDRRADRNAALRREIKAFAKSHGVRIRYGRDKEWVFEAQQSVRIPDREGMLAAMQRAVDYGEAFDRAQWVRPGTSSKFVSRTLTTEELEDETAERGGTDVVAPSV